MTAPTVDTVVEAYTKLREQRSELKKDYEVADEALKAKVSRLEVWLMQNVLKDGTENVKTKHGTAYLSTEIKVSSGDWTITWDWLLENRRLDMLEKRLSSKAIQEYKEESGEYPAGVNISSERVVRVRKS